MSDAVSLLPQNATPLMRAVSLTNAERRPIAPGPIADLWDPATCPAPALPYLAAAHGVSIWRPEWSEDRKRQVIAQTIVLKRRRGTVPCFEKQLAFVDAELLQVIAPPNIAVARNSMTPAEREAWLAQFPELRIRHARIRGHLRGVTTPGRPLAAIMTLRSSRADEFASVSATVVDRGAETPVTVQAAGESQFGLTYQVAIPVRVRKFVPGRLGLGFRYPQASDASDRLYAFSAADGGPDSLRPGMKPVEFIPKHVAQPRAGLHAVTGGQALAGPFRFLRDSQARLDVYDSVRLFDPARARAGKVRARAGFIAGATRLGQPAFHLELAVDLSFQKPKARRFPNVPGFVETFDPSRTSEAMAAVRAAKLGRDKVEVRTNLHRRIRLGDGVPLNGTYRLGQIIRSLR